MSRVRGASAVCVHARSVGRAGTAWRPRWRRRRGGGDAGPNLLRSQVVLSAQHGESIRPIVNGARRDAGMPAINIPEDDVTAVAEFIHSVAAAGGRQGRPPAGPPVVLNILVGSAAAGQVYF